LQSPDIWVERQARLTASLWILERDGLVQRVVYPVAPPRTDYSLTELVQTLVEPLRPLCLWGEANFDRVLAHRARYRDAGGGSLAAVTADRLSAHGQQYLRGPVGPE